MRSGLLTEVIKILRPQRIESEYGEEKYELVDHYTTRARVVLNPTKRGVQNDEIFYDTTRTLTVRYYVPVEDMDVIEWSGKRYRIISIQPMREWNEKYLTIDLIND